MLLLTYPPLPVTIIPRSLVNNKGEPVMESSVLWATLQEPGLEQLRLVERESDVIADGLVIGVEQATPFRFWYQVRADRDWIVRECTVQVGGDAGQRMGWHTDGRGRWTDAAGAACPALDGCLDLDMTCTPFTNTLAIRRLRLAPGESAEILVAYLDVPALTMRPARQRYSCIWRTVSGGLYRYEGLETGATYDLLVDDKALVVDYPGIWKRAEVNLPGSGALTPSEAALDGLLASGPHPDLADKLQLFGQFVGDWDADWTGYPGEGQASQTANGEIHFAWALDGRVIQDVWIFPNRKDLDRGQPLDEWGSTLRMYDADLDAWRIIFCGPVNRVVRALTARPVGDEIWIEGPNLKGQPLRWIFSRITSHTFHWSNFVSEDGGRTWRLQEELDAHRVR
jgi:uncharacterized protein